MNFTFPRATLIKAIPTMRFQLDDEVDQSETLKDFFMKNYGEEVEITNSLLAKLCEVVEREYVFEMIQGSDETDRELCAAFLIVMPYEMFTHGGREVCPFGSLRYSTVGGVIDNPIFKLMWEHRDLDQYNMEDKLADILAQTVFNNSEGVEELVLSFKTPLLRSELCFMCDPNKYVEYLPTLSAMNRYDGTLSVLECLTSKALESISHEPYPMAMMDAITNNAMSALYFLNEEDTPHAYRRIKEHLDSIFVDNKYTVVVDGRTAIRCGYRNKLIAFLTLNKGEVIDTPYFDTMFAHIDRNLYLKASDKFRRNATSGAYGTGGRVRDVLADAKKRTGERIEIPFTLNPQFTEVVPKLENGIYVSVLENYSEPLLNQLVQDDLVEITPDKLESTDAKHVIVKYTNEDTLAVLKDKRALADYAMRENHQRVVLVPAKFSAGSLGKLDNVHTVYENPRDGAVTISERFTPMFGRRGRGGRREVTVCLNAVAYKLHFDEKTTSLSHSLPHFI